MRSAKAWPLPEFGIRAGDLSVLLRRQACWRYANEKINAQRRQMSPFRRQVEGPRYREKSMVT